MTYHYIPENVPSTLHPRFFAKYLPEFGVDADVLASSFSPFSSLDMSHDANPNVHRTPLGRDRDRMKELHRWETFLCWHLKVPDWGRPWISPGAAAGIRMLEEHKYDLLISFSPCFSAHRAALRIKQRFPELPWFAYLADPFVGNPFLHANPVQQWLNERLEKKVFEAANGVIANTEAVEAIWRDRYPQLASKFSNIPNGFDLEESVVAHPIPDDRKTPILMHAGSLYGGRFPKMLFESMDRLTRAGQLTDADLHVQLVGGFDAKSVSCPDLIESMKQRGNLILHEPVSRPEALRLAGEADYLLLVDLNEANTKFQVPSKLFDYLRIGRPILCYTPRGSETQSILLQSGVPFVIIEAEASAAEADRGLVEFLKLSSNPQPMSSWARKTFDAREMTRQLLTFCGIDPNGSASLTKGAEVTRHG